MFYGKDFQEIISDEDIRFIRYDGITVSEDALFDKLLHSYRIHYGYLDYADIEEWLKDNQDEAYEYLVEIDNAEFEKKGSRFPFGLRDGGWITVDDELYVYCGDSVTAYNDVYDELEVLWEEASGHLVDDDGGFEFEAWCLNNPVIVRKVLSGKHLLLFTDTETVKAS